MTAFNDPAPRSAAPSQRRELHDRPIRSGREFCVRYFPKAHAEKRCRCYPQPGILVILPRPGVKR